MTNNLVDSLVGSQKAVAQSITDKFLTFSLAPDQQALLATQHLLEIVSINLAQITAIAGLDAYVMGIYNWRGDVTWVVDLASMLGYVPIYAQEYSAQEYNSGKSQDRCHIIFLRSKEIIIGFAVHNVGQMVKVELAKIQSSAIAFGNEALNEALSEVCSGYWLNVLNETHLVLDGLAIMQRFE